MASDERPPEARFISEVFHNLSQPLTALHCTLDLALQRDASFEQLRASVESALAHAECLRQRLLLVRALSDAGRHDCELRQPIDIVHLLRELVEDLQPLFESAGKTLELETTAAVLPVRADTARLQRALFAFLEYLFSYLRPQGTVILTTGAAEGAEVHVAATVSLPVAPEEPQGSAPYSCEIELVRRTFAAHGGNFALAELDGERSIWRGTLPLA
jgi:signal transduction histidine kinase